MPLIPGTLLRERSLKDVGSHLDKASIFKLMEKRKPTDFGLVELHASKHVSDVPMYAGMILNQDFIYVDGGYTFRLPHASDTSTKIIENPNKGNEVGKGGDEFTLILSNANLGYHGAIITFDKLSNCPELEVTGVTDMGGKVLYKLRMSQGSTVSDHAFVPSELLQPGSKLFKIGSVKSSEFGQNWDGFQFKGSSEKEYYKELGTAEIQISYNMTRQAVRLSNNATLSDLGKRTIDQLKDSVTEYMFMDSPIDPQIKYHSDYTKSGGSAKMQGSGLIYTMDDLCIKYLAQEENTYLMYGKGGIFGRGDNFDKAIFSIGIYHQLDKSGYKDEYDLNTFGIHTLVSLYRKYSANKQPHVTQGNEPIVRFRTGKGGLEMVSPFIEKYAISSLGSFQQQAASLGIITGDAKAGLRAVKPTFTSCVVPGIIDMRFEYEPSFDPFVANDILNPFVKNGFRLSSYTFLGDDYVTSAGNIKILKDVRDERDVTFSHVAGTESHPMFKMSMGGMTGFNSSGNATGFSMFFSKRVPTPWVVDPTNMMKLAAKNPKRSNFSL